jgi:hypothetical protein
VAGADGNGQRVELRGLHELGGFLGVGEQRGVVEHAFCADAVLFTGHAGFERTQAAQLAFDRDADLVRQLHDLAGHVDVVVEGRRRLAVFVQRTVHHHG